MKIKDIGNEGLPKYRLLVPKDIVEKVLHWDDNQELDYDVQIVDGEPVLCIAKKA